YWAVRVLPGQLGLPSELGVAFITATTSLTAWLEATLLRRAVTREVGPLSPPPTWRVWTAAVVAGGGGLAAKMALTASFGARTISEPLGHILPPADATALWCSTLVLGVFGGAYLAL